MMRSMCVCVCVCIFSPNFFGVAKLVIINKKIYPNWLSTKYEKYIKKKSKNSFIFWLPAGNDDRNLAINNNNNNILKIGKFRPFFHKKMLHICQKSCFPVHKKCTNLMTSSAKSLEGQNFLFWMHACMTTTTTTSAVVIM